MKNKIRVVLWGLGVMGSGIANMILSKKGFTIVGAIDIDPNKVGKRLYEILGLEPTEDNSCLITNNPKEAIRKDFGDVCLIATASSTKAVFSQVKLAAEAGMDIVTTAEEMSYPRALDPELSEEMDKIAKENGVSILGTGVNPGFIMDMMVIMLTGVCDKVEKLEVARINDLSCFGRTVMEEQGIGLKPSDFIKGVEEDTITGHVGFRQSFGMFEEAFNIELNNIREVKEPIITSVPRATDLVAVEPGDVAGCRHLGYADYKGSELITMEHPQQIRPELQKVETGDYITIKGYPTLEMQIKPEIPGGIATVAICVNMIPLVMNSDPGLKTMLDLPIPRAIMGDVRDLIK